jgi:hypothetical protein
MERATFAKLLEMCDEIEQFRFCGPGDDPDEQTAVVYGFKFLAKRFVGAVRRIKNRDFQDALNGITLDINGVYGAYDLHADLQPLIDQLRELAEHPEAYEWSGSTDIFVESSVIADLRQSHNSKYDLAKVVRFCEELNSAFASGNYLASCLLIRALLNHIPPVFGHTTFQQVVSQSPKSVKELLKPLEEISRDVADLHTHSLIRHKESLPTKSQIAPFKASLEVLLHEIIAKVQEPA